PSGLLIVPVKSLTVLSSNVRELVGLSSELFRDQFLHERGYNCAVSIISRPVGVSVPTEVITESYSRPWI
ncbi:MAG: hypothetical protein ACPHK0_04700, partial [Dehalococcoidia bacterium]